MMGLFILINLNNKKKLQKIISIWVEKELFVKIIEVNVTNNRYKLI